MIKNFLSGAAYVGYGCRAFYGDKKAWKYAAIPLGIMLLLYCAAFAAVVYFSGQIAEYLNEKISALPGWLSWLHSLVSGASYALGIAAGMIILGTTVCLFYEISGSFFFDSLTAYYEKKKYGIPSKRTTWTEDLKHFSDSLLFAIRSSVWFIFLFILGFFLPVSGQILLVMVMGYYLGISYMLCPAFNSNISISQLRQSVKRDPAATLGFGITAYLLLMIPFSTLFLLPGLVLGGTELFNDNFKKQEL